MGTFDMTILGRPPGEGCIYHGWGRGGKRGEEREGKGGGGEGREGQGMGGWGRPLKDKSDTLLRTLLQAPDSDRQLHP